MRTCLRNLVRMCEGATVPEMPTLADIAEMTGVTVPTVSKVLNGRADVSPETRAKILQLIETSGYRRRGRQGLSAERVSASGVIDVLLNPIGKSWAIEVLGGVQRPASEAGFDVAVWIPHADSDWLERVVRRGSRGVIAERIFLDQQHRERLTAAHVPFVVIDPGAEPPPEVPSVGATNWKGGYSAAEHLVELGHRSIAVIGGGTDLASRARVDGFRSALAAHQCEFDETLLVHADWSRTRATAAARRILTRSDRPTAVFACSDRMASGVYVAAHELGLRIPEDVSVIGFDDLPEVGWLVPSLTTVRQPVEEMGRAALQLILGRSRAGTTEESRLELSTKLIVRESTAALPEVTSPAAPEDKGVPE